MRAVVVALVLSCVSPLAQVNAYEKSSEAAATQSVDTLLKTLRGLRKGQGCVRIEAIPDRLTEEQLTCIGAPYAPLIKEIQEADPVADARREARESDFRLLRISGAWSGPMEPGIACAFDVPKALIRARAFFSDAIDGEADLLYRRALLTYAYAYNRTIVSNRTFPYPDICRLRKLEESDWRTYLSLSEFRGRRLGNRRPSTLHIAARSGDANAVRHLLKKGEDFNKIDIWGFTPLGWAVLVGNEGIVAQLLAKGANADRHGDGRPTPLNLAINARAFDLVHRLVEAGADVNLESIALQFRSSARDAPAGGAPLWTATKLGELRIARYLLGKGAEPDKQSPIFAAISAKRHDLLHLLISHGADVTARDGRGMSAIQAAAEQRDPEAVRLIATAGGLADARSKAERRLWWSAMEHGRDGILADLVAFGANSHLLTTSQRDRLGSYIKNNQHKEVLDLLAAADVKAAHLETAIKQGNLRQVRDIYRGGAEIAEGRTRTGLIMAVKALKPNLVKWFLEQGADPLAPLYPGNLDRLRQPDKSPDSRSPMDREGTALSFAFQFGPIESIKLIISHTKFLKPEAFTSWGSLLDRAFFGFRKHKDPRIIDLAVKLTGEIPKTGPQADAFLKEVCFWTIDPGTEVLETWLKRGYRPRQQDDPPPRTPGYPGDDRAFNECLDQSAEAALLMLRYGADPNQLNSIGDTPLSEALDEMYLNPEYLEVIKALLRHGADPNRPDRYGQVVLDQVQRRLQYLQRMKDEDSAKFSKAERLLLKYGAKTRKQLEQEGILKPKQRPKPERAIPVR